MTTHQAKVTGALVGSLIRLGLVLATGYYAWDAYKTANLIGVVYWSALWLGMCIPGRSAK